MLPVRVHESFVLCKQFKCSSSLPGICLCVLPFSPAPEAVLYDFLVSVSPAFLSHRSQQCSVSFPQSEQVTDGLCCIVFPFVSRSIMSKSMAELATCIRANEDEEQQMMSGRNNFRELMAHVATIPVMISASLSRLSAVMGSCWAPYCSLTCM